MSKNQDKKKKLTARQDEFVKAYVNSDERNIDRRASDAAKKAGYANTSVGVIGADNLKKQHIKDAIEEEQAKRKTKQKKGGKYGKNSNFKGKKGRSGGPRKMSGDPITCDEVEKLAGLQCTMKQAASFFGVNPSTFSRFLNSDKNAMDAWESGKSKGQMSLLQKQFKLADRNAAMCIWLGKQYLDQKDTQYVGGDKGNPIEHVITAKETLEKKLLKYADSTNLERDKGISRIPEESE